MSFVKILQKKKLRKMKGLFFNYNLKNFLQLLCIKHCYVKILLRINTLTNTVLRINFELVTIE